MKGYANLRDRCVKVWKLHPDCSGSVADLWNKFGMKDEPSAALLFHDLAALIDVQRAEIEALERLHRAVAEAVNAHLYVGESRT